MRRRQITAMVLALVASTLPIAAQAAKTANPAKIVKAADGNTPKGLFYSPSTGVVNAPKDMNLSAHITAPVIAENSTSLTYWIELLRGGQTHHVTNRQQFKSGDKIRFHVRPSSDGYAYVLLSSGSRGEKAVLFPDPKIAQENKLELGKDYALPADGYLTFDKNPGKEKVTLLLSKNELNADEFLSKPAEQPTIIASLPGGSKDLAAKDVEIKDGSKDLRGFRMLIASSSTPNAKPPRLVSATPTPEEPAPEVVHTTKSIVDLGHKGMVDFGHTTKSGHSSRILVSSVPVKEKAEPKTAATEPKSEPKVAESQPKVSVSQPKSSKHKVVSEHHKTAHKISTPKPIKIAAKPTGLEDDEITVIKKTKGVLYVSVDLDHHS